MSKALQLEVVTPDKQVVNETVDYVSCPGILGEFGVLPQHVSLLSALKIGALSYRVDGKTEYVFVSGGFADVNNDKVSVLVESAERARDIDAARAQAAKDRAEKRLEGRDANLDHARAQSALHRAVTRLSISSRF